MASLSKRSLPRILLLLVLALVVTSMIVPNSALDFLRIKFAWVDRTAAFLALMVPGLDMDHLASFGVLGFAMHYGWPRGRTWQVAAGVFGVAVLVEIIQVWIPGREPAVSHALLDLIGGMCGFGLAWLLSYAWGSRSLPQHPQT